MSARPSYVHGDLFAVIAGDAGIYDGPDVGVTVSTPVGSFLLVVDAEGRYHLNFDSAPDDDGHEPAVICDGQAFAPLASSHG